MEQDDVLLAMVARLKWREARSGLVLGLESLVRVEDFRHWSANAPRPGDYAAAARELTEDDLGSGARGDLVRWRDDLILTWQRRWARLESPQAPDALLLWLGALTPMGLRRALNAPVAWSAAAVRAAASVLLARELAWQRAQGPDGEAKQRAIARLHDQAMPEAMRVQWQQQMAVVQGMVVKPPAPGRAAAGTRLAVIVHGTGAASNTWWRDPSGLTVPFDPAENLWRHLHGAGITHLAGHGREFLWSGHPAPGDRLQGARDFLNWWHTQAGPTTALDVVAHSHGGNVVMLAQAMEPALRIHRLVLLGTPANYACVPRMAQTRRLHNVYSQNDGIQAKGAWLSTQRGEGRTQSDGVRSINWHLPWMHPHRSLPAAGHSELHHPDFWAAHHLVKRLLS